MTAPRHEAQASQLLARLEAHWEHRYSREEVHHRIRMALREIEKALSRNARDTRLISSVLARIARGETLSLEDREAAERAFQELLGTLGVALVGILPGAFVTLPALYALARHFHIELPQDSADQHP